MFFSLSELSRGEFFLLLGALILGCFLLRYLWKKAAAWAMSTLVTVAKEKFEALPNQLIDRLNKKVARLNGELTQLRAEKKRLNWEWEFVFVAVPGYQHRDLSELAYAPVQLNTRTGEIKPPQREHRVITSRQNAEHRSWISRRLGREIVPIFGLNAPRWQAVGGDPNSIVLFGERYTFVA